MQITEIKTEDGLLRRYPKDTGIKSYCPDVRYSRYP